MRIRVVLVDDQDLVRAGFAMLLESRPEFEVVGEADDGDSALDLRNISTRISTPTISMVLICGM